jgi:hypothetical protein
VKVIAHYLSAAAEGRIQKPAVLAAGQWSGAEQVVFYLIKKPAVFARSPQTKGQRSSLFGFRHRSYHIDFILIPLETLYDEFSLRSMAFSNLPQNFSFPSYICKWTYPVRFLHIL